MVAEVYLNVSSEINRSDMAKNIQSKDPEFLSQLTFEPLTKENWGKFVQLFGERGAWKGQVYGGQSVAFDPKNNKMAVGKDRENDLVIVAIELAAR